VLLGGVHHWSPDGTVEVVVPKRRGIGGLVLHADGGLVVAGRDVSHFGAGEPRRLLELPGVVGFNDMITDARGRVYVGSLRSPALTDQPRVPGELWRIDGPGRATEVYADVPFANGVGFSPDGKTIYQSDYDSRVVLAHDLGGDGRGLNRRILARVPANPDGLCVDSAGTLWVALAGGGGVARLLPSGEPDGILEIPASFVSSVCFGGADGRDLFVTTGDNREHPERQGTIFRTRVDVPGLIAPPARV
jgi:gluconolactonase